MIDTLAKIVGVRALLILIALLIIGNIGQGVALKIQSVRLATANAKNETKTAQMEILGNELSAQDSAIDQMIANAAQQDKRLKTAQAAAGKVQVITKERIRYLQTAVIPTSCTDAITWGALHAVEIGKQWEEATP